MKLSVEKSDFERFRENGSGSDIIVRDNIFGRVLKLRALILMMPALAGCMNAENDDFEQEEYSYYEQDAGMDKGDADSGDLLNDSAPDSVENGDVASETDNMNVREVEKSFRIQSTRKFWIITKILRA